MNLFILTFTSVQYIKIINKDVTKFSTSQFYQEQN